MCFKIDKDFSIKARTYQDKVYQQIYGNDIIIDRYDSTTGIRAIDKIDELLHIDVIIHTNFGKFSYQEKALRHECLKYNTFTIEYHNNGENKNGEYFNCLAQYYLHGYSNQDNTDYIKWYIIRLPDFLYWAKNQDWLQKQIRKDTTSQASFLWINYNDIPKELIWQKQK